jgi:hypothetical protein
MLPWCLDIGPGRSSPSKEITMRNKLAVGGLALVVGFLVATNPVVVDAAGFITSAQIKNGTIKSIDVKNNNLKGKDIKDGSLTAADLAAGTVPAVPTEIKAVRRLANETAVALVNGVRVFGDSATVTTDANDIVVVSATLQISSTAEGDDLDFSTCIRPAGALTAPVIFDSVDSFDNDVPTVNSTIYPIMGSGVPGAGTWEIGACVSPFSGTNSLEDAAGTVTVIDGTTAGPLGKASSKGDQGSRD